MRTVRFTILTIALAVSVAFGASVGMAVRAEAVPAHCDNREYLYERGLVFQSLRQQERQLQLDLADQPLDVQRRVLRQFRIDKRRVMRIWIEANPCK